MKTITFTSVLVFFVIFNSYGQWIVKNLSEPKAQLGSAVHGTKAYFAGGYNGTAAVSDVEIYDIINEDWDSTIQLSEARVFPSYVTNGSKVYFAGGINFQTMEHFSTIDIWDTETNKWSVSQLLFPRFDIGAVSYGDTVMFAGGVDLISSMNYDIVDVINTETGDWSIANLSEARGAMGVTVIGNLAMFAGGFDLQDVTDKVDIYNFTTKSWSTATLSEARGFIAAVTIGNKAIFAGGMTSNSVPSDRVDIYDISTDTWEVASLSEARALQDHFAAVVGDKAYFIGGGDMNMFGGTWNSASNVIDIYDDSIDSWSVEYLSEAVTNHAAAGVDDHLIIAGGTPGPPWNVISTVNIYIDPSVGITHPQDNNTILKIYPNPMINNTKIDFELNSSCNVNISLLNQLGQHTSIYEHQNLSKGKHSFSWNTSGLSNGIYFVQVRAGQEVTTRKIVKMK